MVAGEHVGPDLAELLGHQITEHRDTHRRPAYEQAVVCENPAMDLEPSGLESVLLDIAIIGGLVVTILLGVMALRNRRR